MAGRSGRWRVEVIAVLILFYMICVSSMHVTARLGLAYAREAIEGGWGLEYTWYCSCCYWENDPAPIPRNIPVHSS